MTKATKKTPKHPCYKCPVRKVGDDERCRAFCRMFSIWQQAYDEWERGTNHGEK